MIETPTVEGLSGREAIVSASLAPQDEKANRGTGLAQLGYDTVGAMQPMTS